MDQKFIDLVDSLIENKLKSHGVLLGDWHHGTVASIISPKMLSVYVDGSNTTQNVPCNPDVKFNVNDEVFVIFINGNSTDKYIISRRAV